MTNRFFVDTVPPKQSLRLLFAIFGLNCVECLFQTALHAELWATFVKTESSFSQDGRFWICREYAKLQATSQNRLRTVFWLSSIATATCAFISLAIVTLGLFSNPLWITLAPVAPPHLN